MSRSVAPRPARPRADVRLLVPALLGWGLLALLLDRPWPVSAGVAVAAATVGLAVLLHPRGRRGRVAPVVGACALVVAALFGATTGHELTRRAGPLPQWAQDRAVVEVRARVAQEPRVLPAGGARPRDQVLLRVMAEEVTARGTRAQVRTPLLVIGDRSLADLRWWESARLRGRLSVAEPGADVVAILRVRGPAERTADAGPVAAVAEHVRRRLREASSGLPPDPAGLLPGLVIGDRSALPSDLEEDMRDTGMTHVTAVSGSNVSLTLAAVLLACRGIGLRRRWRPAVALLALAGFVVLVRPDPSVLRAATMGAIGLLGLVGSRTAAALPALGGAVILLLAADPWLARSPGFALSTLATLGLVLFARPWGEAMARHLPRRLRPLAVATAVPLAAQAMCAPVIVLVQGGVPVVGVLANLLAAPLIAPATIVGVGAALAAAVVAPVGAALVWPAGVPTWGIALVARSLAALPFGTLPWPEGTVGAVSLAAVTVAVILFGPALGRAARRRPAAAAALLVVAMALGWPLPRTWAQGRWRLVACDVGQGDALVVSTGPGRAVVVDAGPDPRPVADCLDRLGVHVIDAVVLTHFHADHAGGLAGVLRGRRVGEVLVSPLAQPVEQAREVERQARTAGVPSRVLLGGDVLTWGTVRADVLAPVRMPSEGSLPNNASVVLDVQAPGLRALLLGDMERQEAADVVRALRDDPSGIDVIKVAHHGSAVQDVALVRRVAAPIALVSVGARNTFGHPAPNTVALVASAGGTLFRTDRDGDIAVEVRDDGSLAVRRSR